MFHVCKVTLEVLFSILTFTVTSLFLLTSAFLCWNQQNLIIRINREPVMIEKWLTPQKKTLMKPHSENEQWSCPHDYFLLTSALFEYKIEKWRQVTSRDVIMSDFHQNFRKHFSYRYCVMVWIWSHLHHSNENYEHFRIFSHNIGFLAKNH